MRICTWVFNILIIALLIPAIACPSPVVAFAPHHEAFSESTASLLPTLNDELLSYDDVLKLLNSIEKEDLASRCNEETLERINQFLILLARHGMLSNEEYDELALENDIEELLQEEGMEYFFSFDRDCSYQMSPARIHRGEEFILCKGWFAKKGHKVKKFVKKHRKTILIGAAIVVAAVITVGVVMVLTPAAASAALAAAGGAATGISAASGSSGYVDDPEDESYEDQIDYLEPAQDLVNSPYLPDVVEDQIAAFKETIVQDRLLEASASSQTMKGFEETARLMGSGLAHGVLNAVDTVTQIPTYILGQADKDIRGINSLLLPEKNEIDRSSKEDKEQNGQTAIAVGHREIDRLFNTTLAHLYTAEALADKYVAFQIGELSLPGGGASKGTSAILKEILPKNPIPPGRPLKVLIKENFRANLKRLTGRYPGQELEAHHILPQKYRNDFSKIGINVDDPKYGVWLDKGLHRSTAAEYNKDWGIFIARNPKASEEQVIKEARRLMSKHGLEMDHP